MKCSSILPGHGGFKQPYYVRYGQNMSKLVMCGRCMFKFVSPVSFSNTFWTLLQGILFGESPIVCQGLECPSI